MAAYFKLLDYSKPNLSIALSNDYTTPAEIEKKYHFEYLLKYFEEPELVPKKIVVENSYISKDYLIDYTNYFAKCFIDYPKKCKRVHFFKNDFKEEEFFSNISKNEEDCQKFWDSYLGFIVVKPIPVTVIGMTVLEKYPANGTGVKRVYFGARDYEINLFGNKISKNSLAFQEQDSIVGACATSAIWSVLHKASFYNYSILKTPSEITKDADIIGVSNHGRLYPNNGLSIHQMVSAFSKAGLVCEVKSSKNLTPIENNYLKATVHAYAPLGVPIILGLLIPTGEKSSGYHAVAITGYRAAETYNPVEKSIGKLFLKSNSVDKLFIHDDQFGPFARVDFGVTTSDLTTEWTKKNFNRPSKATAIIIPVYHKIRLSFENIYSLIHGINIFVNKILEKNILHNVHWDIAVFLSEEIKKEFKIRISGEPLTKLLTKDLPKYIWKADCYYGNELVFQIFFDATDLQQNMFGLFIVFYKEDIKSKIHNELSTNPISYAEFLKTHPRSLEFINFIIENSKPTS